MVTRKRINLVSGLWARNKASQECEMTCVFWLICSKLLCSKVNFLHPVIFQPNFTVI